ncbi:hypothetical protein [Methyloglobulus morosus]|uniref:hypothetical protein n=1 Tax=Methyloglobulus morosus TaxID=1410681 RepID=UPI00137B4409|nr:hypothetical protein [Methyloglobulus morosus]
MRELESLIEKSHGTPQLEKAAAHIRSVARKLESAGYHYQMALGAFENVFPVQNDELISVANTILGVGESSRKYRFATLAHESNVIALAHVMHSMTDVFSHVIYDSLNLSGLHEDKLNLSIVSKNLPAGELKDRVVRVLGLQQYNYLNSLVNTSKHIQLVETVYSVDMTGESKIPHGLKFKAFKYKTESHAEKYAQDFLVDMKTLSSEYVLLGSKINVQLRPSWKI